MNVAREPEDAFGRDAMLDNIMLCWLTNASASAGRLYWESFAEVGLSRPVTLPVAVNLFPDDITYTSHHWAERLMTNIVSWNEVETDGHLAALSSPTSLCERCAPRFALNDRRRISNLGRSRPRCRVLREDLMMRFPMVQPVTEMTRAALGARLAHGAIEYLELFDDHAVFEFPFNLIGQVRIEGTRATADNLDKIEGSTIFDRFDLMAGHSIAGDGMVLEYFADARVRETGLAFRQNYAAVVRTSGDRVNFYREYLNRLNIPGVAEKAMGTQMSRKPLSGRITSLDDILKIELGDRIDHGAGSFLDMLADDGVLECPFTPRGAPSHLQGKAAFTHYHGRLAMIQDLDGLVLTLSYPAEDPGRLLLKYDEIVRNKRDDSTCRQQYLAMVEVVEG